jgi:acetylglutamate kinase
VTARPLVIKLGGELLEEPARLATIVAAIARVARQMPAVIVHGGGREIDAALKLAGIEKRQVDGLRVTDERTLDVVVAVLAGTVNTRLVAALNAAGVAAVGLTGADARCGLSAQASMHVSVDGQAVDLERVGVPVDHSDPRLLHSLIDGGFVPVVASIGTGEDGQLYNVNADALAGHFASRLGARRLVIAGTTPGVRGDDGATVRVIEAADIKRLVAGGTATAGMIAKLRACERALANGVDDVLIVDGQDPSSIEAAAAGSVPSLSTRLMATALESRSGA